MGEIAMLLFDFYTQQLASQAVGVSPPHPQLQKLKQLVGEEAAIEIWDAAQVCRPCGSDFLLHKNPSRSSRRAGLF